MRARSSAVLHCRGVGEVGVTALVDLDRSGTPATEEAMHRGDDDGRTGDQLVKAVAGEHIACDHLDSIAQQRLCSGGIADEHPQLLALGEKVGDDLPAQ